MIKIKGKIYLTSDGYKSYEIFEADQTFIFKMADVLIDKLEFKNVHTPLVGLEGCYIELYKSHVKITVGWDNWSGCFAMAHSKEGDKYIIKLGEYFDEYL